MAGAASVGQPAAHTGLSAISTPLALLPTVQQRVVYRTSVGSSITASELDMSPRGAARGLPIPRQLCDSEHALTPKRKHVRSVPKRKRTGLSSEFTVSVSL
ncbi:MAG: hypothetical protein FRX48_07084 [Lasallia pustulata]|uniref:Uncharacterized protein n=1 Tax=Lasallia pustulata TaxID=136370 RepID=A0A5M8PH69_9LECA|nr:MAG: hypothetical protein FRX48_07084 [Lasallia pustulata]